MKPKKIEKTFDELAGQLRKEAKRTGLKQKDISEAIKEVRKSA